MTAQDVLQPFVDVAQINDTDKILIEAVTTTGSGSSETTTREPAMILAPLFRAYMSQALAVTIGENGHWYIGGVDTGVSASNPVPQMRVQSGVIQYSVDGGTTWSTLVDVGQLVASYIPTPSYDANTCKLTLW